MQTVSRWKGVPTALTLRLRDQGPGPRASAGPAALLPWVRPERRAAALREAEAQRARPGAGGRDHGRSRQGVGLGRGLHSKPRAGPAGSRAGGPVGSQICGHWKPTWIGSCAREAPRECTVCTLPRSVHIPEGAPQGDIAQEPPFGRPDARGRPLPCSSLPSSGADRGQR